jgi:hypothetical protein
MENAIHVDAVVFLLILVLNRKAKPAVLSALLWIWLN